MAYRKYIGSVGDINPLGYNGGIVLRNTDKTTYTMIYFMRIPCPEKNEWWVHQIDLDPGWYDWVSFEELSQSTGITPDEYKKELQNGPLAIAQVLIDIGYHYGFANLDEYPEVMTKTEINKHWGRWI